MKTKCNPESRLFDVIIMIILLLSTLRLSEMQTVAIEQGHKEADIVIETTSNNTEVSNHSAYEYNEDIEDTQSDTQANVTEVADSDDESKQTLNAVDGVHYNDMGYKETWYNLEMAGVVKIMRNAGFSEAEFPYWVRSDGVKMLGDYVMVAADLALHPRGSIVETSLGAGIVCDTGDFIRQSPYQFDIAVTWQNPNRYN